MTQFVKIDCQIITVTLQYDLITQQRWAPTRQNEFAEFIIETDLLIDNGVNAAIGTPA